MPETTLEELRQRVASNGTNPTIAAESLVENMSEPTPGVVQDANGNAEANSSAASVLLDDTGVAWNSDIHATGADGKGVKTDKGTWRKKRKSRVGSGATAQQTDPNQGVPPPVDPSVANREAAMRSGQVMAGMIIGVCMAFGGEEFKPRKEPMDEQLMLSQTWGEFFHAKNVTDLPPGWALAFGMSMYILPRFAMPETRRRSKTFAQWVRGKTLSVMAWWNNRRGGIRERRRPVSERERSEATEAETNEA